MSRTLRVLMYHRVLKPANAPLSDQRLTVTPESFEQHVRYLAKHYHVVSAEQAVAAARGERALPPRAVLITFDDGYRDFGEVAWPILRRYGLPATLFVPTAFPGRAELQFWWDRLYQAFVRTSRRKPVTTRAGVLSLATPEARTSSVRTLVAYLKTIRPAEALQLVDDVCRDLGEKGGGAADVLTWEELRRLNAEGLTIGGHTRTHPALTQLTAEETRAELRAARAEMERQLGAVTPVFAYPFGDHNDQVVELVRQEGYELAVTCRTGVNRLPGTDPLRLHRINIGPKTTTFVLGARLSAVGVYLDRWRARLREARLRGSLAGAPAPEPAGRSPKVAYIMSRFPKLSETFVLNEILAVESLGAAVEVYPLLRERQDVSHPEAAKWVERAHFHPFLSLPILRAQLHYLRRRPGAYFRLGAEVLGKTWGSANFFVGALGILPKAVRFAYEMERQGIQHVHAHFATHPTVAALIVHRLTGIPFSFTAHGSDLHVERRMLNTKVAAAAFAVAISDFNREVMVKECGEQARRKIHVIHCGVDPEFFRPAQTKQAGGPFRIVCVASLEAVKGHAYLIEACRLLQQRGVDFQCELVGEGPQRQQIEAQIAQAALGDRVHLLGGQPRPKVARLLAGAHAAVLASHPTKDGKREGIPVALMEAMSAGLPVVATAISGIPELVESGVTGILVPSGDPVALADALERLNGDRALCVRLGRAGRNKVMHAFSLRASAATLIDLIERGAHYQRAVARPQSAQQPGDHVRYA